MPQPRHCPIFPVVLVLMAACAHTNANTSTVRVQRWQVSDMDVVGGDNNTQVQRSEVFLSHRWQARATQWEVSYAHQPLLIRSGEPAHNGYFHQLDLQVEQEIHNTRINVKAGIHGSSNMFRYSDFHEEMAVLSFSVLHSLSRLDIDAGINGDYRFGHFRLYPRVKMDFQPTAATELVLDLPIAVYWQNPQQRWRVGVERYGEKWAALDRDRDIESALYLQEWRLSAGRRWRLSNTTWQWGLMGGISVDTEVEYLDLMAGWQRRSLDPSLFVALEIVLSW